MKTVVTQDGSTVEDLADAAGERAKSCVDAGVEAVHSMSGKARQMRHDADGYVRENPWLTIGAAAGVGLLVGLLFRRRR